MNKTWRWILGLMTGIPFYAFGDDMYDKNGMNDLDHELVADLKRRVQEGIMTREDAIRYLKDHSNSDFKGDWESIFDDAEPMTGKHAYVGSPGQYENGPNAGFSGDSSLGMIGQVLQSLVAYYSRNELTGAEREQNAFNAGEAQKSRDFTEYMTRNKYQMETQSMQQAGINPAMVYGGGNLVPTTNNTSAASGSPIGAGNIGDLLATMVRMPRELKLLDAEIAEKRANANLTNQKTETEKANTRIQSINADYQEVLNDQTLRNLRISYDDMVAGIDVKTAQKDEIKNRADAQAILNTYLDERQRVEIDKIKAEKSEIGQKEKYEKAQTTYQNWYNNFVQQNNFLPSSNDVLMLGTYIASVFGLDKSELTNFIHDMMDPDSDMNRKWRNNHNQRAGATDRGHGGWTSPTGGAQEGSTGAGSR